MALTLGQLVSGAGRVGAAWRQEEEAQRIAQQNQLKIEEQNRIDRLRQNELKANIPVYQPVVSADMGQPQYPVDVIPQPAEAAVPAVPVVPVVQPGQEATAGTPAREFWDTKQPMSVISGKQPVVPTPQQLRAGLTPPNVMTQAAKKPVGGAITADDMANLAFLDKAKKPEPIAPVVGQVGPSEKRKNLTVSPEVPATAAKPAAPKAVSPEVQNYFAALEQQNGIPQGILAAIMQQESKGIPGQTSRAGAQGYFQFMPDTAAQYGVKVNDFGSESQGAAKLLGDLYRKYNGDTTKVLAAYNWGQGNVDREGLAKAPKETRDYIAKVGAVFNPVGTAQAAEAKPALTIVPAVSDKVMAPAPKEQKKITDFYMSNPNAITEDMSIALRRRDELVRLAKSYQDAGMGLEYTGARMKVMELDESMFYLQGMQGLNDLAVAKDPRRLSAVWSRAIGQPVGIQPRTDGSYNVFINGNKLSDPYSADDVSKAARSSFDKSYVKQLSDLAASQYAKAAEAQIDIAKENAKQLAQMIRESAIENIKGVNTLNVEKLKNMNYDVKPTGRGDGTVIITPPFGGTPYLYNPEGKTVEIDGVKITSNAAYPISGLPSISGMPQIAKR